MIAYYTRYAVPMLTVLLSFLILAEHKPAAPNPTHSGSVPTPTPSTTNSSGPDLSSLFSQSPLLSAEDKEIVSFFFKDDC